MVESSSDRDLAVCVLYVIGWGQKGNKIKGKCSFVFIVVHECKFRH